MSFLPALRKGIVALSGGAAAYVAASSSTSFSLAEPAAADPTDCKEVACSDKKSLFLSSFNRAKHKAPPECPLNRAELGKATWELLHTTAAYYPEKPSEKEKQAARDLVNGIALLYPCTHCRAHFAKEVEEDPPDVRSRESFSIWLCKRHNKVNKWLDKPLFNCTAESLQTRWRKGAKECHQGLEEDAESAESSLGQD